MGFFDKIKSGFGELTGEAQKLYHKNFLQAMTASSAMIAASDGNIDEREKDKMLTFIKTNPDLEVFTVEEIMASFDVWIAQIVQDVDAARGNMFTAIAKLKKNESGARMLMRLVVAIGESDGEFDETEKAVAREIANELGLKADEFIS